ncbi:MAG TPA: HEAT repeat domain-containing protein [Candidatus Binataceae bacterium]|nr:HEAT repeat domain-containing protein [Candidatus Binataceae bacterium]
MLTRFVGSAEPVNENQFFALLRQCADKPALGALLDALAKPAAVREPFELASAVEAALAAPALVHDAEATQLFAARLAAVNYPATRASLTYLLGWRDDAPALNRLLGADPAPKVRAAAAVALRNCKTPPDFAALWRAAKNDPDGAVRAQAYQTLDRFGQLHTADDFLAASRAQTEAASIGRFLGRWLRAEKSTDDEKAETLTRIAERSGSAEASGALSEIVRTLEPPPRALVALAVSPPPPAATMGAPWPGARAAAMRPLPVPAVEPPESGLQKALYLRRARITNAALAQFAASRDMREDAARGAIQCALAVNRCGKGGCVALGQILGATDRLDGPLALEASHDVSTTVGAPYFAHRRRQYGIAFAVALLVAALTVLTGFVRRGARTFAIGVAWLLVLVPAAMLQFSSGSMMDAMVWPPLRLWPATALGSVAATLLVAEAVTLALGRRWLVPGALLVGEAAWWLIPALLDAWGISLAMQHYSPDENWLPFMLALVMAVGAPLLTLALSGAAWGVQRMVLAGAPER